MKKIDWKKTLIELLIVFVGVYGAFMLNSYRQGLQEDEARIKYYNTFLQNLEESNARIRNLKSQVDNVLAEVEDSEVSDLPYNRDLDFTSVFFVLESAYAAENFQSLSTQYLNNIEFGSNLIKQIEKRFDILDEEVRRFKIYGSNSSGSTGADFKQWYVSELNYLSDKLSNLSKSIEGGSTATRQLIEELE